MIVLRSSCPSARVPRRLQRACACGKPAKDGEECEECRTKRAPAVQRRTAPDVGLDASFAATPAGLPRLPVNAPDDAFEREADAMADAVMRGGGFAGSRPCPRRTARREAGPAAASPSYAPPVVHEVLRASGAPLDPAARAELEPRFGRDFSGVRVHTDGRAAASARAVQAVAYTVGGDIVFDAGAYAPHTATGRRLLAHELAHVVQQDGAAGVVQRAAAGTEERTDEAESDCSGWLTDPQSLSKRAAEVFVRGELPGDHGMVKRIECDPPVSSGNWVCVVHFSSGTTVKVLVTKDTIVVGAMVGHQIAHPRCWYDFKCPGRNRDLVLVKRRCEKSPVPSGDARPKGGIGPTP